MADYDGLWKALPEVVTLALIRSLLPETTAPLTPWKTEMAVLSRREIDGSFLAEVSGMPVLFHLEYQNYLDASMPRRIHEYVSLLEQQLQSQQTIAVVVPIVIWAVAGPTPRAEYHVEQFGKVLCHREYFELHLPAMDWQSVDPLLLVLAPYLNGVRREDLPAIALRLYEAAPEKQQAALLGAFLALSERKFADFAEIEQSILQQVRKQMDEIMQAMEESSFGVAMLERGKAEGKTEGLVSAVQILWQSRFGSIPPEVMAAVQALTEPQLQELLTLFASAPNEADVRARLGL